MNASMIEPVDSVPAASSAASRSRRSSPRMLARRATMSANSLSLVPK